MVRRLLSPVLFLAYLNNPDQRIEMAAELMSSTAHYDNTDLDVP